MILDKQEVLDYMYAHQVELSEAVREVTKNTLNRNAWAAEIVQDLKMVVSDLLGELL